MLIPLYFIVLKKLNATFRMQQMEKTHGRRGKTYSRAFTITDASRHFEKDRVTLYRWIRVGILRKCGKDGVYCTNGKYVWGCDIEDLLCDPHRKKGKRLLPVKNRARRSKWQIAKSDPERAIGPRHDLMAVRQCVIAFRFVKDPSRASMLLKEIQPALEALRAVASPTTQQR